MPFVSIYWYLFVQQQQQQQHYYCRRTCTCVYLPARTYDTIQHGKTKKNNGSSQQQQTISKYAQQRRSSSTVYALATLRYTMLSKLVAVLQQYMHTCSRQSSGAPPASTYMDWRNSQQQKKAYGTAAVYTYLHVSYEQNVLPDIMSLQVARSQTGHQSRDSTGTLL